MGTGHTKYERINAQVTKDGTVIRELMHPRSHASRRQSLAEATVAPGQRSKPHRHLETEELYHFLSGHGEMGLGGDNISVSQGDTVCIPPGTVHWVRNDAKEDMRILCCCSPAYSHEDTELL